MTLALTPQQRYPGRYQNAPALPLARTDFGMLIGPVLVGHPELQQLTLALNSGGGTRRVHGYNGIITLRQVPHGLYVTAHADRPLSAHGGQPWIYQERPGSGAFSRALRHAAPGEPPRPAEVRGHPGVLTVGDQSLDLPAALAGRLQQLVQDLRAVPRPAQDQRWYGSFDLTVCGDLALLDTPARSFIVDPLQLASALEQAHGPRDVDASTG